MAQINIDNDTFKMRDLLSIVKLMMNEGMSLNEIANLPIIIEKEGSVIPIKAIDVDQENDKPLRFVFG